MDWECRECAGTRDFGVKIDCGDIQNPDDSRKVGGYLKRWFTKFVEQPGMNLIKNVKICQTIIYVNNFYLLNIPYARGVLRSELSKCAWPLRLRITIKKKGTQAINWAPTSGRIVFNF